MKTYHLSTIIFIILASLYSCKNKSESDIHANAEPRKKLEVEYALVDDIWEQHNKIAYEYDENGNLKVQRNSSLKDSAWQDQLLSLLFYDDTQNLLRNIRKVWKDEHWQTLSSSTFLYDSGKIKMRIDSAFSKSSPSVVRHTYRFNKTGLIEEELGATLLGDSAFNSIRLIHFYNNLDLITEKKWQSYIDGVWANTRRMLFEYDENNFHIRTLRQNWKNEQWVDHIDYELTVDKEGVRTAALWKMFRDSSWRDFRKVTYDYY